MTTQRIELTDEQFEQLLRQWQHALVSNNYDGMSKTEKVFVLLYSFMASRTLVTPQQVEALRLAALN